jgi:hypothetical protein
VQSFVRLPPNSGVHVLFNFHHVELICNEALELFCFAVVAFTSELMRVPSDKIPVVLYKVEVARHYVQSVLLHVA